jgi:hypothetical protein
MRPARGNLPVDELLEGVGTDAPVGLRPGWRRPRASGVAGAPAEHHGRAGARWAAQGPAAWCPEENTVVVDRAAIGQLEDRFGALRGRHAHR